MARTLHILTLGLAVLIGAQIGLAQEPEMSMADMQKMLKQQQVMLEQQQALLEQQAEQMGAQKEAIESLSTRLDQAIQLAGQETPELSPETVALRERLSKVEDQLESPPDTPENVLVAGEFPGSIRIPGTNMAGKVGGNVRLGFVGSLDPIGTDDRFVVGTIPVPQDTAGQGARFTISAKRSRMNLDMRMDSSVGQFRAFVEGDFAGQGGTDNYRLRHAYGQYNRFILGQTWSTFVDRAAVPEELDFEGLNALTNKRQPLFRWTKGLGNNRLFAVGLEDPAPEITGGEGVSVAPDLAVRISRPRDWGHFQAAALLRNLTGEREASEGVVESRDSEIGWGLSLSSSYKVKLWDERDNLKWQLNYGQGIGRYINDMDSVGGLDAAFDPMGTLRALPAFGGYVAFQHWWKQDMWGLMRAIRSTVVYGYTDVDTFSFQPGDTYSKTQRATINVIWSPISSIDLGVEYLWGERTNKDQQKGAANQFQMVATFRF